MTAVMSTTLAGRRTRQSAPASKPATVRLRITRRGRVVVTLLLAAPLIVVAALFGPGAVGAVAGTQSSGAQFEHVTVSSGQSLWQIAEKVAPNADPRDVVSDIVDLNGLSGSVVVPGERLAIPQQYTSGR